MGFEDKIGQRIRKLREQQGLSREMFCGDESQLSVRQLIRIESGQSMPTLLKLKYIAKMLDIKLSNLLDDNAIIPKDYYQLKYELIKIPHYKDKQRIAEKYKLLDKIYSEYMEVLSEDELMILDLVEKRLDISSGIEVPPIQEQYSEEFQQIIYKQSLSMNDLQILDFYFVYIQDYPIDELYENLAEKVFNQSISDNDEYNRELINVLLCIAGVGVCHHDYKYMMTITKKANDIINQTRIFSMKPNINLVEIKHYLYIEKDMDKAKTLYDETEQLAQMFGNDLFVKNLRNERKLDGL